MNLFFHEISSMFPILSNTTPVALPISAVLPCFDPLGWMTSLPSDGLVLGSRSTSGTAFLQRRRVHQLLKKMRQHGVWIVGSIAIGADKKAF